MSDVRDRLEREIHDLRRELLRIDENGRFVYNAAEKREIAKQIGHLEARVEEWRV
jgi:hypothetical protein